LGHFYVPLLTELVFLLFLLVFLDFKLLNGRETFTCETHTCAYKKKKTEFLIGELNKCSVLL
jgi:hypothetical protein